MLRTSQTEYFDIMLLHWQHTADWVAETTRWQDGVLEAQSKKIIRTRGASVHGLPALRQMPGNKWLEVAMIRMNHNGTRMDGPTWKDKNNPDQRDEVVEHVKQVKKEGMGVISMKLVGARRLRTARRPPGCHALCFQERRGGLRHRRIQEHTGDRRGNRQPECCADLGADLPLKKCFRRRSREDLPRLNPFSRSL